MSELHRANHLATITTVPNFKFRSLSFTSLGCFASMSFIFCPERNAPDYLALQEEHLALEVEPLVEVGFHNLKKDAAIFNGQIFFS